MIPLLCKPFALAQRQAGQGCLNSPLPGLCIANGSVRPFPQQGMFLFLMLSLLRRTRASARKQQNSISPGKPDASASGALRLHHQTIIKHNPNISRLPRLRNKAGTGLAPANNPEHSRRKAWLTHLRNSPTTSQSTTQSDLCFLISVRSSL